MIYSVLISIYNTITAMQSVYERAGMSSVSLTAAGYLVFTAISLGFSLLLLVLAYIFRGIGLKKLAVRRGLKNAWLAFVPFGALILIGELGQYPKKASATRTFAILATVFTALYYVFNVVIDALYAIEPLGELFAGRTLTESVMNKDIVISLSNVNFSVYNLLGSLNNIIMLVSLVFTILCYSSLFRVYRPEKSTLFSVLGGLATVFLGTWLLYAIFVFASRDREPQDYAEFINRRYARFYGSPYSAPRQDVKPENRQEEPFGEFSHANPDDPFGDIGGNGSANSEEPKSKEPDDGSDDMF